MSPRSSGLFTTTAILVLLLCAVVLYRTSTGWRSHEQPTGEPPILKLDPNVAPWEELACLPQIGPSVSKRIVEYRDAKKAAGIARPFATEADLDKVTGIGPRTLEEIRPYLTFQAADGSR